MAAAGHRLGEADRDLDRLGAAGVEGGALEALGEHLGEPLEVLRVLGGVEHARGEPSRLLGERRRPARMAVADGGDAHRGGEVEVAASAGVDEVRTLTVRDDETGVLGDATRAASAEAADGVRDVGDGGGGGHAGRSV